MEDINRLLEGLNLDVNPHQQPDHTMRYCLNFVASTEEGNTYAITNEKGTLIFDTVFPVGFKVMGWSVLNNEIIVILVDETGHTVIGVIKEDDTPHTTYKNFHPLAPVTSSGAVVFNNHEFGFSQEHPIDCISRVLINGHRMLYFTDNNVPFGVIDLDEPPVVNSIQNTVALTFTQSVPVIESISITGTL